MEDMETNVLQLEVYLTVPCSNDKSGYLNVTWCLSMKMFPTKRSWAGNIEKKDDKTEEGYTALLSLNFVDLFSYRIYFGICHAIWLVS